MIYIGSLDWIPGLGPWIKSPGWVPGSGSQVEYLGQGPRLDPRVRSPDRAPRSDPKVGSPWSPKLGSIYNIGIQFGYLGLYSVCVFQV